ncbi:vitamin B12-transporter ATPase [Citrobacter koseri]|uniref:Vitamin B12-transporter ATPase n=1 Tax=Citrobacter koseri TaxID=545 RepID=A0A2X2WMM6_CITKO|nr:vitamin B12-transporter ATPase [Citrobacter koseri]
MISLMQLQDVAETTRLGAAFPATLRPGEILHSWGRMGQGKVRCWRVWRA